MLSQASVQHGFFDPDSVTINIASVRGQNGKDVAQKYFGQEQSLIDLSKLSQDQIMPPFRK